MAWLKIDDHFVEHRRIEPLSDRAFRLHVAAMCSCARKLTDGHVSEAEGRVLCALTKARPKHIDELQERGVWEANGDGWMIHDFLDYNPDAETVKAKRKAEAERLRAIRKGRRT